MCPRSADLSRRRLLAGAGTAALGSTAGCTDSLFSRLAHSGPEQLGLTVTTLPADEDTAAVQIARQLGANLEQAGIDTMIEPKAEEQLLRDVLMDHDFDIFVARHPGVSDPDALWSLLHSQFIEETGWQNPFGFSNDSVNQLLDEQRSPSERSRSEAVTELQETLFNLQPFTVVGYPDHLTAANAELDVSRIPDGLVSPFDYFRVGDSNTGIETLQVGILNSHVTRNRNPLAAEFRTGEVVLSLLYEPLVMHVDDEVEPWLAEVIEWEEDHGSLNARIEIRPDASWHDGEPLTARDIAFTYRFLSDTALDEEDASVPAPRFRDRTSLVEDITDVGNQVVELQFDTTDTTVASRALTVPILPEHVWIEQTEFVEDYLTDALVWDNEDPIGSGPFEFVDAAESQEVILERYDDHFLRSGSISGALEPFAGGPTFERLEFHVPANSAAGVELVEEGDLHLTASPLRTEDAAKVNRSNDARLIVGTTDTFYLVGFNSRRHPMHDHRFRAAVARLVDRAYVANEVFGGYAEPSDTVLKRTAFMREQFEWTGTSRAGSFPGEDGQVDQERARDIFVDAGFRYSEDGELLVQN